MDTKTQINIDQFTQKMLTKVIDSKPFPGKNWCR